MRESASASTAILLSPACCPPLPPPARGPPSFQTDTCIYFSLLCISHFPLWVALPAAGVSQAGSEKHLSLLAAAACQPHLSCPKNVRREASPFLPYGADDHGLPRTWLQLQRKGVMNSCWAPTVYLESKPLSPSPVHRASQRCTVDLWNILQARKWARWKRFV